jgi:hypothetical protein
MCAASVALSTMVPKETQDHRSLSEKSFASSMWPQIRTESEKLLSVHGTAGVAVAD